MSLMYGSRRWDLYPGPGSEHLGTPPERCRVLGVALLTLVLLGLAGCSTRPETTTVPSSSSTVSVPTSSSTTSVPYATTTVPTPTTAPTTTSTTGGPVVIPAGGKEYVRVPGDSRVVALTFDAAYDPSPLGDILEALRVKGTPATFFFTGEFVEDFPDAVSAVVAGGYPIGNHSYSHPDFTTIGADAVRSQLARTASLLEEAGAGDPRPLFRFPYGARDEDTLALVGREGYVSVYWTIDTLDWEPERTTQQIRDTVLTKLRPGAIILMHVGSRQTADILPALIDDLRNEGYGFVDLRTVLGDALRPQ